MKSVWILVADSSCAKIFEADLALNNIEEVRGLQHSESRLREQELTTDLSGSNIGAGASHHRFEPHTSLREQELLSFSREVVSALDEGRQQNAFAKLVLVAAPDFLGHIRNGMNSRLRKLVVHEVDKNVVKKPLPQLRQLLPKTFFSNIE